MCNRKMISLNSWCHMRRAPLAQIRTSTSGIGLTMASLQMPPPHLSCYMHFATRFAQGCLHELQVMILAHWNLVLALCFFLLCVPSIFDCIKRSPKRWIFWRSAASKCASWAPTSPWHLVWASWSWVWMLTCDHWQLLWRCDQTVLVTQSLLQPALFDWCWLLCCCPIRLHSSNRLSRYRLSGHRLGSHRPSSHIKWCRIRKARRFKSIICLTIIHIII